MASSFFNAVFFSVHYTTKSFRKRYGFGKTRLDRARALNLLRHLTVAQFMNEVERQEAFR